MTKPVPRELVTAAARGDEEALASLVRAYHDRVYRFGVRVCRDGADADDAVQEAFIKLARRPLVMSDPGVLSWLMTVVRNACRRLLRRLSRRPHLSSDGSREVEAIATEQPDPEQALERWQLVRQVHAGIAALAAPYREVIILRDVEGMSGEETSAALGLDPDAMKTRLHRARTQLRAELERIGPSVKPARAPPGG